MAVLSRRLVPGLDTRYVQRLLEYQTDMPRDDRCLCGKNQTEEQCRLAVKSIGSRIARLISLCMVEYGLSCRASVTVCFICKLRIPGEFTITLWYAEAGKISSYASEEEVAVTRWVYLHCDILK